MKIEVHSSRFSTSSSFSFLPYPLAAERTAPLQPRLASAQRATRIKATRVSPSIPALPGLTDHAPLALQCRPKRPPSLCPAQRAACDVRKSPQPASPRSRGKAVEDYRSPRRFAMFGAAGNSARSWTAPALWRFDRAREMDEGETWRLKGRDNPAPSCPNHYPAF
jgi:hypothetical protein